MPRKRLTATVVENAKPSPSGELELWDELLPGFGLRVSARGRKSFVVFTRLHGRKIRVTLGHYPAMSLAEARERARATIQTISCGDDPRRQRTNDTAIESVVADFLTRHARPNTRTRTADETERLLRREVLYAWKGRDVREIRRRDVIALLDDIVDRPAPYVANRTLAALRKMFRWAIQRDLIDSSPCSDVVRPHAERKRERVLADSELRAVWLASFDLGPVHGPYIRALIATGQRMTEVADMRHAAISDDTWQLEPEDTKAKRTHLVPLSRLALAAIDAAPQRQRCPYVFSNTGKGPIRGFSKIKAALDKASGVSGWRLHDLRRTAATAMARGGVDRVAIERVLNHADPSVTAVYDRHAYEAEKRHALEVWAAKLERLQTDGSSVIELSSAAGP